MKTLKAIVLPLLCVTSAQYTSSQSNHVNGFSGIPLWPFDGQVRPEYASHAVFRDIQTGDLIVSYLPMSISVDQSSMSDRKELHVDVRLDPPHPGTNWEVPHLNIGNEGQVHLEVPSGYDNPSLPKGSVRRP